MTFSADILAQQLTAAIALWHTVTGVDPDARSFRLGDLDVVQANRELTEAQKLDPTPITAYLMLASFAKDYLARRTFSVNQLLDGSQQTLDYLEACRKLKTVLASAEIQSIGSAFATVLRQAVQHYDAATAAVEKLISQPDDLAFLRRDALRSMEQLRVDQFLRGQTESTTPVYHKSIFQWWNINSLLRGATTLPSGVSIHLIRDADAYQSYFCFCVRNGGNLFLLSDAPAYAHPLQGQMSRRPDRQLSTRAARNWFPYNLMDLEDNEDGGVYVPRQEGLVAYQAEAVRLREIRELEPPEILWIAMMFDQIVDRFWRAGYHAPRLSYTADMIRVDSPLLDAAQAACLPITRYDPLILPPLTPEDMRDNPEVKTQLGSPGGTHNAWMEERYGLQVDPSVLNLIGSRKGGYYLSAGSSALQEGDVPETSPSLMRQARTAYKLEPLPPTLFGDRERLVADRSFLARYNRILSKIAGLSRRAERRGASARRCARQVRAWSRG
jgi:hypothetical protein